MITVLSCSRTHNNIDIKNDKNDLAINSKKNIHTNAESQIIDSVVKDTIASFLRENISVIPYISIAFCTNDLLKSMHDSTITIEQLRNKISNYFNQYDNRESTITAKSEIRFLKKKIVEGVSKNYDKESKILINELKERGGNNIDTNIFYSLVKRYGSQDLEVNQDISFAIYTFIITEGPSILNLVKKDSTFNTNFKKWINDLPANELVAYYDEITPTQIVSRKKEYIISIYKNEKDDLSQRMVKKLQSSSIIYYK